MLGRVRILIFHGYLLSGTGSNVYNASLARAMRLSGHEVHLICQDRETDRLDFVDATGRWVGGELQVTTTEVAPAAGSLTVYTPEIGGILPVYVLDRYAGFVVKEFPDLTDPELGAYIEHNVAATRDVVNRAGPFDAALANHLVMAPVILARAGLDFAIKVHGSDLSYTILPNLERFRPYALEGAEAANGVLVGSDHIGERLRLAIDEPAVNAKVALGPPGVDTSLFAPLDAGEKEGRLNALADRLAEIETASLGGSWDRDPAEAAAAVRQLARATGPRAVFVGKLIVSKGVDLLLAAWPLVVAANPDARLLVAGFGEFRDALEQLWAGLVAGDGEAVSIVAQRGRGLEGGEDAPLRHLSAFLANPPPGYDAHCAAAAGSVAFAGRLEHNEVAELVPAVDALIFPSTFPEAFGMVAAEAAAAGVLPVSAGHSGALEVSEALAADLPAAAADLVTFPVNDESVRAIADRLLVWFELPEATRKEVRDALRQTSVRLWSWERVARVVVAASTRGD